MCVVVDPRGPVCPECRSRHRGHPECDPERLRRAKLPPVKHDYAFVDGPAIARHESCEGKAICPRCKAKLGKRRDGESGWQCEDEACSVTVREVRFKWPPIVIT